MSRPRKHTGDYAEPTVKKQRYSRDFIGPVQPLNVFGTCAQKRAYRTKELADHAVAVIVSLPDFHSIPGKVLGTYECDKCYRWHIGNSKQ